MQTSKASYVALSAALLFGFLACAVGSKRVDVQRWWTDRGPVVPHDDFPADCSLCHTGNGWHEIRKDFTYDHFAETGVALEGAHASAECLRCHNDRGPVALFAQRGCSGCHEDVHQGQLGSTCETCHTEVEWRPRAEIELHAKTRFPLVGAHAAAACWRCHPGADVGDFVPTDTECVTCHASDLATATDPDHQANGWTSSCDRCHIPTTWGGSGFSHALWPLTGAHVSTDCSLCHAGGTFAGTPTSCDACHLGDYQGTTDPDHGALGFPTSCELCHDTGTWEGAVFDHAGITTNCVDCHLDDYQGTTRPDHDASGFPTTCEQCHDTDTWEGAVFAHTGITNGCVNCHLDDYQATTGPNHTAAGFPTSCELCHNVNTWFGAVFDHSFPITGRHSGFGCGECHLTPRSFRTFSCTHCHEHSFRESGDEHDDVRGYTWNSQACVNCHPNGNR